MLKSLFHTPKRRTEDCPRNAFELRGLICVSEGEKGKNILSRKKETRLDFLICLPFSFHIKPLCLPFACLNSHDHVMEVGKVNRLVVCDGGRKFFECCGVHIVLSGSDKVSIGMVVRYNPNIVGGLDTFGPDRFANIIF